MAHFGFRALITGDGDTPWAVVSRAATPTFNTRLGCNWRAIVFVLDARPWTVASRAEIKAARAKLRLVGEREQQVVDQARRTDAGRHQRPCPRVSATGQRCQAIGVHHLGVVDINTVAVAELGEQRGTRGAGITVPDVGGSVQRT